MADHYGDEASLRVLLKAFDDETQLTDELIEELLTSADDFILDDIDENSIPSTTPRQLVRAATYWAAKEALDIFYNTDEDRSPTARHYEKLAYQKKEKYLAENPTMKEEKVYSHSHTPTDDAFRRTDSGYVDPNQW